MMDEGSSIGSDLHEENGGELTMFDDLYYCDEESFKIEDISINKYDDNRYIQNLLNTATINILNPPKVKKYWLIIVPLHCSISFSLSHF